MAIPQLAEPETLTGGLMPFGDTSPFGLGWMPRVSGGGMPSLPATQAQVTPQAAAPTRPPISRLATPTMAPMQAAAAPSRLNIPAGAAEGAVGAVKDAYDAYFNDLGTRGNVGGDTQLQQSNQSLSDRLRSTVDAGGDFFKTPEGLASLGELGINSDFTLDQFPGETMGEPSSISQPVIDPATGGVSWTGLGTGGLGTLGGLYNLWQGVKSGDPGQISGGALSTLSGASEVSGSLGGPTLASTLGGVAPYIPVVGSFLSGLFGPNPGDPATADAAMKSSTIATGASTAAMMAGLLGPVGAAVGPALYIGMALNQALNPKTNYNLQKMAGEIGPQTTEQNLNLANALTGFDYGSASNEQLMALIPRLGGNLVGLYNPVGAGAGTSDSQTALSRYMEGLRVNDPAAYEAQTRAQSQNTSALLQSIAQLQARGVDNATIGRLMDPYTDQIWDAWNPANYSLQDQYATPYPGGADMFSNQPSMMNAYGGSTFAAIRKLLEPSLTGLYGVQTPGYTPDTAQLQRIAEAQALAEAARYQDFTSGGG